MEPWSDTAGTGTPQWNALQWDSLAEFYPWRLHYARSVSHGVIPFWNPYQFSGTPFAANGQSAVFYPLNLLFVIFGPMKGFTAGAVLHLFLAALFTFLLARRLGIGRHSSLISGMVYAFSAFMVVWLELPTFINVAAWLPLVLLLSHMAMKRRSLALAAWAGAAAGLAVLAGHLQIAFYCWFAAGLWWCGLLWFQRKDGKAFKAVAMCCIVAVVTALLVASPQLLPTLELARESHRSRPASAEGYQQFVSNAVPSHNLLTFFVPDFFGNPSRSSYWLGNAAVYTETALYVGVLSLLLAVLGGVYAFRRRGSPMFFAAMAVGSLLIAFGTPLNALFYYFIPGFNALGGPNRIIILYSFAVAMLAGFGSDWLGGACANPEAPACDRSNGFPVWAVALAVALIAVSFVGAWFTTGVKLWSLAEVRIAEVASLKAGIAMLVFTVFFIASLLLLFIRSSGGMDRRSFLRVCIVLIGIDLFIFGMYYNPSVPRERVYPKASGIQALKSVAGDDTIAVINPEWSLYQTPHAVLPPNAATVYELYDAGGYDSLFLKSYKDRIDNQAGMDCCPVENGNMVLFKEYNQGLQNIAEVVVSAEPINDPSLVEKYNGEFFIYRVKGTEQRKSAIAGWRNPNRMYPVIGVSNQIHGWKRVAASGAGEVTTYCYEPDSIRLGIFLFLMAVTFLSGLTVYNYTRRRAVC